MDREIQKPDNLKYLLDKANRPKASDELTNLIMGKIKAVEVKDKAYNKDIKRSWFFIGVAILGSLLWVFVFTHFEPNLFKWLNKYLTDATQILTYVYLSVFLGFAFYQLNNLFKYQFAHFKKGDFN